jgi:hypothetical protein
MPALLKGRYVRFSAKKARPPTAWVEVKLDPHEQQRGREPVFKRQFDEKFEFGTENQAFVVESVNGRA